MNTLSKTMVALTVMVLCGSGTTQAEPAKKPLIQMAILLDTSSSMDGLINQAKTQLWKVVNEFVASRKDGQRPELQVALYEYGKSSLAAGEGYLRQIVPLTTDLDRVSEELFALTTNGGDEYCGQVIQAATRGLSWSASNRDLKVIFIAGNEPFTQGPVDYRVAAKEAISKGIVVNTIHCGSVAEGVSGMWKEGATLADGSYLAIDQNQAVAQIVAPQDAQIAALGQELNRTYIPIGRKGAAKKERQQAQDVNASSAAPAAAAERAVYKASGGYAAGDWDLVSAEQEGRVKVDSLAEDELPAEMQKMSAAERKAYVAQSGKKRAELQQKIQKLSEERKQYLTGKQKQQARAGASTLDTAMIEAVRGQAVKKEFKFE